MVISSVITSWGVASIVRALSFGTSLLRSNANLGTHHGVQIEFAINVSNVGKWVVGISDDTIDLSDVGAIFCQNYNRIKGW